MYRYFHGSNFNLLGFLLNGVLIIQNFTSLFLSRWASRIETDKEGEEGAIKPEQSRTTDQINGGGIRGGSGVRWGMYHRRRFEARGLQSR